LASSGKFEPISPLHNVALVGALGQQFILELAVIRRNSASDHGKGLAISANV